MHMAREVEESGEEHLVRQGRKFGEGAAAPGGHEVLILHAL